MVEVLVLVVPCNTGVMLTAIFQCFIHRSKILETAQASHPQVCRFGYVCVVEHDSKREPALEDLRVIRAGDVIAVINLLHDGDVHQGEVQLELVLEDNLQI